MKKVKLITLIGMAVILVAALSILPACQGATETVTETVVETVTETVTETVEVEAAESPFTYEALREMANAGVYDGDPAAGHTLAFANIIKSFPFCTSVENNIIEEWGLAGGASDDLTILDNAADAALGIQNADIIFNKNPEVFLEFNFHVHYGIANRIQPSCGATRDNEWMFVTYFYGRSSSTCSIMCRRSKRQRVGTCVSKLIECPVIRIYKSRLFNIAGSRNNN